MRKQYIVVVDIDCDDAEAWTPQDVALAVERSSDVQSALVYSSVDDLMADHRDGHIVLAHPPGVTA